MTAQYRVRALLALFSDSFEVLLPRTQVKKGKMRKV
jgi:hypothetical protein